MGRRVMARLVAPLVGVLALAGCGGDPLESGGEGGEIVVGSADFPENVLLAEIYAAAMRDAGEKVTTNLRIGTRESLVKGLEDGSLTVVPEYTGNLLSYLDENASETEPDEVYGAVQEALPDGLAVLDESEAQDSDVLVVTDETAEKHDLSTVEDLASLCEEFTLGAAGEWKQRWEKAIEEIYGCRFQSIQATDAGGPVTVQALSDGKVDVANLFTTSSAIEANGFVQLTDTERMYPAQNVVPLVRDGKLSDKATGALNDVSEALDTETLTKLVVRVEVDKENAADVAEDFLSDAGIG